VTAALVLYGTIWISLVLFTLAEAGKRGIHDGRPPLPWAWPASLAGCAIAAVHVVIAMDSRYHWDHAALIAATARQTNDVFGVNWGGGAYLNYVFIAAWALEIAWWRIAPSRYASRPPAVTWAVRAFFFVMILNAAVVFAGGWRRAAGVILVLLLAAIWWPARPRVTPSGAR
jgi:hypothetical protein